MNQDYQSRRFNIKSVFGYWQYVYFLSGPNLGIYWPSLVVTGWSVRDEEDENILLAKSGSDFVIRIQKAVIKEDVLVTVFKQNAGSDEVDYSKPLFQMDCLDEGLNEAIEWISKEEARSDD